MSFFRSAPMSLCQIILHTESAFNCIVELGYLGKVQFRAVTQPELAPTTKRFQNEIHRCQKLLMMVDDLNDQIKQLNIKVVYYPAVDVEHVPNTNDLQIIETKIEEVSESLAALNSNVTKLKQQQQYLTEYLEVLRVAEKFFTGAQYNESILAFSYSIIFDILHGGLAPNIARKQGQNLAFLCGTIPKEKLHTFELILWRLCRGNLFMKHSEMYPRHLMKQVFLVFFLGEALRKKILTICDGFGITIYDTPATVMERLQQTDRTEEDLLALKTISEETQRQRFHRLLLTASELYIWKIQLAKILNVYSLLQLMSPMNYLQTNKYLMAEVWIPTGDIEEVRRVLYRGSRATFYAGDSCQTQATFVPLLNCKRPIYDDDVRPTYFKLNKFSKGFQHLIDAYGMAVYKELNPTPYTIITFPFLFAVMFGDVGHGLLVFIFGLWMLYNEQHLQQDLQLQSNPSEIWNILFNGRYIITLMGIFSIYTGLIYNDCFSKGLNLFGSSWRAPVINNSSFANYSEGMQLDPARSEYYLGTPYPMGMDPVWKASGENAITTFNSLKMKLAIILGVAQMLFGLILSAINIQYREEFIDLIMILIPQLLFMLCIFSYLVFLIFYKWMYFGGHYAAPYNSACAPSILIIFINMLLQKKAEKPPDGCEQWMFTIQKQVQLVLLSIAMLCVPVLLAGKPLYFMYQKRKIKRIKDLELRKSHTRSTYSNIRKSLIYNVNGSVTTFRVQRSKIDTTIEKTDMSELWIHSGIHCIESILGSVSHTASYLRLWALSLAHEQLSTVLWNMVLQVGLTGNRGFLNSILLYILFLFWSTLTVAILVVMEGLSAFLHTLRLHWVEFQSKFYAGSGEPFLPFQFERSKPMD